LAEKSNSGPSAQKPTLAGTGILTAQDS
jgi:hypothetical protein